ncbi:Oidioi.mRNA.OKI2018_I69.XSR.g13622.t1.cds [Oikopleura dioica]|uniref:Oidioi.mRNA.OKI2018_I69.XSR.g13622.t1.cds n=1 Tax=Oikopleura dioica TaxID=34765 RepID=A0ABN7SEC9_OIKDI|nr:Oidioi.mRNA.OKI2018_I69.XSR.g13622.t1.cds [Oikopleura dioica]
MKRTSTPSVYAYPLHFNESIISEIENEKRFSFTAFSENGSDWSILSLSQKSTTSSKSVLRSSAKGLKKKICKKLRIRKLRESMRNKLSKTEINEIMVPPNSSSLNTKVSSRIRSAKELDCLDDYDIVAWEESLEEKAKFRLTNPFKRQKK